MRCGRRGGGGRECTRVCTPLCSRTLTHSHAHMYCSGHKHAAISVSTRNPCTHPCKQTPSVYTLVQILPAHTGTTLHTLMRTFTLKCRPAEQPPSRGARKHCTHVARRPLVEVHARPCAQCPHTRRHTREPAHAHTCTRRQLPRASLRPQSCGWPMRALWVLSPRRPVELSGSGLGRGEGVAMGTPLTPDPCGPRPSVFYRVRRQS